MRCTPLLFICQARFLLQLLCKTLVQERVVRVTNLLILCANQVPFSPWLVVQVLNRAVDCTQWRALVFSMSNILPSICTGTWHAGTHLGVERVAVVLVQRRMQAEAERHVGVRQVPAAIADQVGAPLLYRLVAGHLQMAVRMSCCKPGVCLAEAGCMSSRKPCQS